MAGRNSAPYIVVLLSVMMFIVGALVLTATDPVMQSLFNGGGWSSSTETGTDLLSWSVAFWSFTGMGILLAILMEIWICTRNPT